ncbi:MAG: hypothetical protein AAGI72_06890 [Pseudomonadota bacterium]
MTRPMMIRVLLAPFFAAVLGAPSLATAQPECPGLIFATGFDGAPTHGSKDALIESVNRGESIRVGWDIDFDDDGEGDLTHWADAAYLSVWQGEVFTQVEAVHAQRPRRDEQDIMLREPYTEWRGSFGSNGVLEGRYSDGSTFPEGLKARISWCSATTTQSPWVLLYRNDTGGRALAGSKQALFAAVRAGLPIQVAWGFRAERNGNRIAVEHLVSPVFLSIVNESDVAAQLPEHIAQRQYLDIDQALFDDPAVMWRGLMTTQGTFDAVWVNRATGVTVRRYPQRATLSWFAPAAPRLDTPSLAVPAGVRRDEVRAKERVSRRSTPGSPEPPGAFR